MEVETTNAPETNGLVANGSNGAEHHPTAPKYATGLIYPPPDIRSKYFM